MADIYCIETGCKVGKSPEAAIAQQNVDASLFPYEAFQQWQDNHTATMEKTQSEINRALIERGRV